MSSRRPARQILVAVLLGVLVGGGLMAVTPAGAQVSQSVATSWKKIWKKNLRPLADKRYYTKAQSDAKYATKAESAAGDAASNAATDAKLGGYYKKTESDARYAGAGSSYTKAESDTKYAPYPAVIRGVYTYATAATTTMYYAGAGISFGYVLPTAPTVHYVAPGAVPPAQCPGTAQRPDALAGNLCVYGVTATNVSSVAITNRSGSIGQSEPFGAGLHFLNSASGNLYAYGTWAVRPGSVSTNPPAVVAPKPESRSTTD